MKKLILFVFVLSMSILAGCGSPELGNPISETNEIVQANDVSNVVNEIPSVPEVTEIDRNSEYVEQIILNFSDTQLKVRGLPEFPKDYVPNIFHLIFVQYGFSEEELPIKMTEYYDGKSFDYVLHNNRITFGLGRSDAGIPIYATMDLGYTYDFDEQYKNCTKTPYPLNDLEAYAFTCPVEIGKDFFQNTSCAIKIDENNSFVYIQHSTDASVVANTCENLKKNGIFEVEVGRFY